MQLLQMMILYNMIGQHLLDEHKKDKNKHECTHTHIPNRVSVSMTKLFFPLSNRKNVVFIISTATTISYLFLLLLLLFFFFFFIVILSSFFFSLNLLHAFPICLLRVCFLDKYISIMLLVFLQYKKRLVREETKKTTK